MNSNKENKVMEDPEIINHDFLDIKYFKDLKHNLRAEDYESAMENAIKNLNQVTYFSNPDLFYSCEDVIYQIAKVADAQEALLEFIYHAKKFDDELFVVMLKAMEITLFRVNIKEGNYMLWCLQTIIEYINHTEYGEDFKLEGEECALIDNADSSQKLKKIYNHILDFCKCFCGQVSNWNTVDDLELQDKQKWFLLFLTRLLGRPLVYMNLEIINQKGEFRLIAEKLLDEISNFKVDLMCFLNCVTEYRRKKKQVNLADLDNDNVSLAVLYYLIFNEKLFIDRISHVLDPIFIFQMLTTLALELITTAHSGVQYKGLQLFRAALERIADFSLVFTYADGNIYGLLLESLCDIMIYSNIKNNRLISVVLFKSFLFKFNSQGRLIILLNIQNKIKSSNFIGFIISITKDLIMKALNEKNQTDLECFTGQNLRSLLKNFCYLNEGAESDLIELSDQIIASLNLLRFLFIWDKENNSGVADCIPDLEKDFFEPLKIGLPLTVAHYKLQIARINEGGPEEQVNITVSGSELPRHTKEKNLEILNLALVTFDLMESLRARTQECLENFKKVHCLK